MRHYGTRLLAVLTALMLLLGALPETLAAKAEAVPRYGKTTATGVAVRIRPDTTAGYHFRVDLGTVCAVTDTVSAKGSLWYKVVLEKPGSASGHTYIGYIKGDCFTPLTDLEIQAWEANPVNVVTTTTNAAGATTTAVTNTVAAVNSVSTTTGATGQITNGGVNFRSGPSMRDSSLFKLERGNVIELLSIPSATDADPWYKARYNGTVGYVQGRFVRVLTTGSLGAAAEPAPVAYTAPAVTAAPAAPAAAAPAAQAVTTQDFTGYYARLALTSANLRKTPNGDVGTQWLGQGSILPIVGATVTQSGYVWYPVNYNGTNYYVRGDCIQVTSMSAGAATVAPVAAAAAPTVAPVAVPENTTATPINAGLQTGYVKVTSGDVNMRLQPSGEKVTTIKRGTVVPVYGSPVAQGGYNWYYVLFEQSHGYVRSEFVMVCNADGTPGALSPTGVNGAAAATTATAAAATTATTATAATAATTTTAATGIGSPVASIYGYVRTIADKVNLRESAAGRTLEQIAINTVLPMGGTAITSGQYVWYPVRSQAGNMGYLRGDCVIMTDQSGNAVTAVTNAAAVNTAANTAVTTASANPSAVTTYGYVMVTKSQVNFRSAPGGGTIGTLDKNTVWPMIGAEQAQGGYTWYPISMNGTNGFVRGDCSFRLSAEQQAQYLSGKAVTGGAPAGTGSGTTKYIQTTADKVYLRQTASKDSGALGQVPLGVALEFSATTVAGGTMWYNVTYAGTRGWLMGTYVKEITQTEYAAYAAANATPVPAASTVAEVVAAAQPTVAGYVKTTKKSVNVRVQPGSTSTLGTVAKGQVFAYTATARSGNYTWYLSETNLGQGYLRGDCVEEVNADGSKISSVVSSTAATAAGAVTTVSAEASYSILKIGSTSSAVRNLTEALKAQGFYSGNVTNQYTSAVEEAVKNFQRARGLSVDGIAGEATQHALFGTVPIGSANTADTAMTLYQAEKIDWYTGGIQELLPRGTNFKIYDVQTGIVWWAHRWAGGSHADIEPLTASDTARLCQIYGVTSAKQIASKNLWQRRPCLITIGNRTFACSLYGVPHNYGADTIKSNNMDGQVCLHFTNSRTHGSKKVDSYHAAAIQYAWEHAPNGHR